MFKGRRVPDVRCARTPPPLSTVGIATSSDMSKLSYAYDVVSVWPSSRSFSDASFDSESTASRIAADDIDSPA